jgi:hypothetical protein
MCVLLSYVYLFFIVMYVVSLFGVLSYCLVGLYYLSCVCFLFCMVAFYFSVPCYCIVCLCYCFSPPSYIVFVFFVLVY